MIECADMRTQILPNTDIMVTSLCLGTMNWGQQNSEEEAHAQLDCAVGRGINFIDTAEMYPIPPDREKQGTTERFLGSWLRARGKRNNLVIATKVSSRHQARSMGTREASGLTRENIHVAVEGSLKRLGTDYIDLYQVHSPDRKANFWGPRGVEVVDSAEDGASIEETLSALTELVKEGRVRAIGLSNETPWGVGEYLRLAREKGFARISTIQNQYSLVNRTFEIGLSEICLREHIGLLPYSALSMGVLSGKYLGSAKPAGARFTVFERNADRYNPPHAQAAVEAYVNIAKKYSIDPSAMAIAFAASRAFTTSVILGATSVDQLQTDIEGGNLALSSEVLENISAVYREYPDPTA